MGLKLKENFPNGFQRKLRCHSHQEKYFYSPTVTVNSKLFWLETAHGQALPLFWVSLELSRTGATSAEPTQPGGVGGLGFGFNMGHQGWGRSGQTKRFGSDPLFRGPNLSGVIIAENEILNALLCSICPFFTFLSLLKLTHLPLKFECGGSNAAWLNRPACISGRLCHLRRDFSSNSVPTAGQSCCFPTALQQQGHDQHTSFYSISLSERYQISHISLKTEAPNLRYHARRTREICLLYITINISICYLLYTIMTETPKIKWKDKLWFLWVCPGAVRQF